MEFVCYFKNYNKFWFKNIFRILSFNILEEITTFLDK